MNRYKHIIWDWNGTLLDDAGLCVEVLNELLNKRGKPPITLDYYKDNFDFPVKDCYESLGFDLRVESYRELSKEYISAYNKRRFECNLHNRAEEALKMCRARELSQSILSAYQQQMLMESVQHFQIGDFFEEIAGLQDHYAGGKIERGIKLLTELGLTGKETLCVGDTIHDYEVAQAIGSDCVLVCTGHHTRQRLQKCAADIVDSLIKIPEFIS